MIDDASLSLHSNSELVADVCIVGSGAAAISIAHRLSTSGYNVILLESSRPIDASGTNGSNRLSAVGSGADADSTAQELNRGSLGAAMSHLDSEAADPSRNFLMRSRFRGYGGTTNSWSGWTRPLGAADFDRSDLDESFSWPIRREDLDRFYNLAIQYCSLGTWDVSAYDTPDYWMRRARNNVAPLRLSADARVETTMVAIVPDPVGDRSRLAFQRSWGPDLERAPNVHLYRNATARYLYTDSGGHSVVKLLASTIGVGTTGRDFVVKAAFYVVAAGGIETTRLLLASDELGNQHGHLGRYFMIHPLNEHAAQFSIDTEPGHVVRGFYSGFTPKDGAAPPTIVGIITPTSSTLRTLKTGNFRVRFASDNYLDFCWEQIPNDNSRLTLSDAVDPIFGDRQISVDWNLTSFDLHTMQTGISIVIEDLINSGVIRHCTRPKDRISPGDHHMGTTRMSSSPANGVVDPNCLVHGCNNLYIASSSVFTTGGYANPTLTIIALSLRVAEHIANRLIRTNPVSVLTRN